MNETSSRAVATRIGDKYLSFTLFNEEYCIGIGSVKEIMGLPEITRLPQTPDFINGVINLRGTIIPVIDLRLKLSLPPAEYGAQTCVIVLDFEWKDQAMLMGIVVDETNEVVTIPADQVSEVPYINTKIKSEYILGVVERNGKLKILLDIRKALGEEEFVMIQGIQEDMNTKGDIHD